MTNIIHINDSHNCIQHQCQDTCRTQRLEMCKETGKSKLFIRNLLLPFLYIKTCLQPWVSKEPNPLEEAASFPRAPKGK